MDVMTNHPPLADRLALAYEGLRFDIAAALGDLNTLSIDSDEDIVLAREIVKPLKALQVRVEATRKTEKAPVLADADTVDSFFAGIRVDLDKVVVDITAAASAYQTKKREEARKLEAAKARIAAAVGDAAPAPVAPAATTRVSTSAGTVAASGRVTWGFEITAPADLPRDLLRPNRDAIEATLAGMKAQGIKIDDAKVPGLRIFEKVGTTWR